MRIYNPENPTSMSIVLGTVLAAIEATDAPHPPPAHAGAPGADDRRDCLPLGGTDLDEIAFAFEKVAKQVLA